MSATRVRYQGTVPRAALALIASAADEDERDASPIDQWLVDEHRFAEPSDLWNDFVEAMEDNKEDFLSSQTDLIEESGLDPEIAWKIYLEQYLDRSRDRWVGRRGGEARMPDPGNFFTAAEWLDKRAKRAGTQWWSNNGVEALELEIVVRDVLEQTLPPKLARAVKEDPSLVRSLRDPDMRWVRWKRMDAWAPDADRIVILDTYNLGVDHDDLVAVGSHVGALFRALNAARDELEKRYPGKFVWWTVRLRPGTSSEIVAIEWQVPEEEADERDARTGHLKKNPRSMMTSSAWDTAREKLRSAAAMASSKQTHTKAKKNPPHRCKTCGVEYRPGTKHKCPTVELLFDADVRRCIPQDFADEIKRELVLGVDDETWETLEKGDTEDNEWIWEAWDDVLSDALIVETPITKGDLVDAILDAEQELAEMERGTIEALKKSKAITRLRAELAEEGERVMEEARELDRAGKIAERNDLLIQHGAVVYTLDTNDNGDVFQVPWGMERVDEDSDSDEFWTWPFCADCGASTAIGTPTPHECERKDVEEVKKNPQHVRDRMKEIASKRGKSQGSPIAFLATRIHQNAPADVGVVDPRDPSRVIMEGEAVAVSGRMVTVREYQSGDEHDFPIEQIWISGAGAPNSLINNPASAMLEDAKAKFEEFHRKKPTKIGEFHQNFVVPDEIGLLGKAVHVLYRSDKKDPATGKQPKKPVDYIHEHYAGVNCYAPNDELEQVEVPEFVREADALVLLGLCLGFRFEDDEGEHDAQGEEPLPELYATPCGKALVVVQDKREVLAIIWGGGLGVWARGIDG